ncbi:uncharacterized protein LOC144430507 [Styela clava]
MRASVFPFDLFKKAKSNLAPTDKSSELPKPEDVLKPPLIIKSQLPDNNNMQSTKQSPKPSSSQNYDLFEPIPSSSSNRKPLSHFRYNDRDNIKIPQFWIHSPLLWIRCVESAFSRADITSETRMFDEVLAVLDSSIIEKIGADLLDISATNPYTELREALVKNYAPTEDQMISSFLNSGDLGDQLPSDLLKKLKLLINPDHRGDPFARALLKKLFLEKLPKAMQSILVASDDDSLEELAEKADKIYRNSNNSPDSSYIKSQTQNKLMEAKINTLTDSVNALTNQLQNQTLTSNNTDIRTKFYPRYPRYNTNWQPRGRFQSNFRQPFNNHRFTAPNRFQKSPRNGNFNYRYSNPNTSSPSGWCFYHSTFGRNAFKCEPGCTFQGKGLATQFRR